MKSFLLVLFSGVALADLGFVYELIRHGARAPINQEPPGFFQVPAGHLTATGMR